MDSKRAKRYLRVKSRQIFGDGYKAPRMSRQERNSALNKSVLSKERYFIHHVLNGR